MGLQLRNDSIVLYGRTVKFDREWNKISFP